MADSPYESSFSKLTAYSAALKQPVTIPEKLDGNTSFVLRSADADELDKFLATLTNENPKTVEFEEICSRADLSTNLEGVVAVAVGNCAAEGLQYSAT